MLDDGNSVGLEDDVVVDDDDAGDSKSSWWAVGVSYNTIDGGEDGLLVDSDGVTEWSKNDGMLDDGNSVGFDDVVGSADGDDDKVGK